MPMSLKMIHEYSPSSSGYTSRILSLTRDPSHSLSRSPPSFRICSELKHMLFYCFYFMHILHHLFSLISFHIFTGGPVPKKLQTAFHFLETVPELDYLENNAFPRDINQAYLPLLLPADDGALGSINLSLQGDSVTVTATHVLQRPRHHRHMLHHAET